MYTIEQMDEAGRWFTLGVEPTAAAAQAAMGACRRLFSHVPFRVVGPSSVVVVCHDPRPRHMCGPLAAGLSASVLL